MEINNNNNLFKNLNMENNRPMTKQEIEYKQELVPRVCRVFFDMAEREVTECGLFRKVLVEFPVPDSKNLARLYVENDGKNNSDRRFLSIAVRHPNSDRLFAQFLLEGDKKEILDYVKDEKTQDKIIESVAQLSKQADDYYINL